MFQSVVLALQWVVFHSGILISGAVVLARGFSLSPAEAGDLMRLTFVITGVGSLLQVLAGHRNRLVEGPAVPWWAAYLVLVGIAVPGGTPISVVRTNIQGGLIIAGLVLAAVGTAGGIKRLRGLFTPRVVGVVLTLVAIQVSGVGVRGLIDHGLTLFVIGVVVIGAAALLLTYARGLVKNSALLLTVLAGWMVASLFGVAPLPAGEHPPVIALPPLLPWGPPTFEFGSALTLTLLGLLMIPNQVGSIKAMEYATGEEIPLRNYDRGLAITGVTNVLSGLGGGIGTTPFAISAGLVAVTGERTKRFFVLGALFFVVLGTIPILGRFFGAIPVPLASAVLLVSVSSLAVVGLQSAAKAGFDAKTPYVVGMGLLVGTGLMFVPSVSWVGVPYWLTSVVSNGVIVGSVVAICFEQILVRSP